MDRCTPLSHSIIRLFLLTLILILGVYGDLNVNEVTISIHEGPGNITVEQNGKKQLTVTSGDSISLKCQVTGSTSGIFWSRLHRGNARGIAHGSNLLTQDNRYSVTYGPPGPDQNVMTSILRIERLTTEDEGEYSCQATGLKASSDALNLVVQEAPSSEAPIPIKASVRITKTNGPGDIVEMENGTKQLTVNTGDSIALECKVTNAMMSVLWTAPGQGISINNQLLLSDSRYSIDYVAIDNIVTSILKINGLSPAEDGEYVCQSAGSSDSIEIFVREPVPVATAKTEDNTGPASVATTNTEDNTGPASVATTNTEDNTGPASVATTNTEDNTGPASVATTNTEDNTGPASVATTNTEDNTGPASLATTNTEYNTGFAVAEEPSTCDITCEEITDPLCHFAVYTYTGFPNIMGHTEQGYIQQYDHLVELLQNCYNHSMEFLCGVLTPHCVENQGLMLPSRKMCEEFHAGCDAFIVEAAGTFNFDCNELPEMANAPPRCIHFPSKPIELIPTVPAAYRPTEPARTRGCRPRPNEGVSSARCSVLMLLVAMICAVIITA